MKSTSNWILSAGLLFIMALGCDSPRTTTPNTAPGARVDVDAGPGGVKVDVDRKDRPGANVDVGPGGVNVDVKGDGTIRENIQERREERAEERAIERAEDANTPK